MIISILSHFYETRSVIITGEHFLHRATLKIVSFGLVFFIDGGSGVIFSQVSLVRNIIKIHKTRRYKINNRLSSCSRIIAFLSALMCAFSCSLALRKKKKTRFGKYSKKALVVPSTQSSIQPSHPFSIENC